jgi:cystathionine gamma-synthase
MDKNIDTLCIHGGERVADSTNSVSTPIYQTATFFRGGVGEGSGYDYSRQQNPTRQQLESRIAALDGAADALALSSGMAAASLLMELFQPGDHIISSDDLYGGTHRLFGSVSKKNGLTFSELRDETELTKLIRPETRAVFVETPTNPTMKIFDVAEIAKICSVNSILLIVDNTFLTPYLQRPLELGADIVLYSGTKYLAGHNDTLAGFLSVKSPEVAQRLRYLLKTVGSALAPFDSWLVLRGLKTLHLRLERQCGSAKIIAGLLSDLPAVERVLYPGIGGMISFYVRTAELAQSCLSKLRLIYFAESLGGAETLITYPVTQTHSDLPPDIREKLGINDRLLRLSVGVENVTDIIADLQQALGE